MGREFLNSGADIVVGGHPHVLQGMEYVDGKPIVYSLGDFWFNGETKYTGLLKLQIDIDGLREMSFVPALQTGYTTQYLDAEEEQMELFGFLENLSPNVEIDQTGVIEYNNNDRNKRKIKGKNWSARCRADRYAVCNCDYFDAV